MTAISLAAALAVGFTTFILSGLPATAAELCRGFRPGMDCPSEWVFKKTYVDGWKLCCTQTSERKRFGRKSINPCGKNMILSTNGQCYPKLN